MLRCGMPTPACLDNRCQLRGAACEFTIGEEALFRVGLAAGGVAQQPGSLILRSKRDLASGACSCSRREEPPRGRTS
jgi:hypothetical protein